MRQVDFEITGVSLTMDNDTFWVVSESPLQILSSSVIGSDLKETRHIMSVRVPDEATQREFALKRPRAFLRERAQALGNQEPVVGLITTLDHERLQVSIHTEGEIKVAALATVGLTHLSAPGRHNVVYTGEQQAGTINLVVLCDARLSPEAEVRAATLATEAKTLALFEADVKTAGGSIATGTSMDTIIVASTNRGTFFRYSGTSTLLGHLIGKAVFDVVSAGVRVDKAAQVKSP
jgi:adenosylcobinamide amidohydrolase